MKVRQQRAKNAEPAADVWQIISLEMDKAGRELGKYFAGVSKNLKRFRLSDQLKNKDVLAKRIGRLINPGKKTLAIYGAGRFHHYTYGLCKAADRLSDSYSYIHFDHHDDYGDDDQIYLNCGSFVAAIVQDTHAAQAIFIGTSIPWERSIYCIDRSGREKTASDLEAILKKGPDDVYLSFDLDVMDPDEIPTDYTMGDMEADELLHLIGMIKGKKRIISADILGYVPNGWSMRWSHASNVSNVPTQIKSKQLYARIAKAVLPVGCLRANTKKPGAG